MALESHRLEVLDVPIALTGPPTVLAPIVRAYRRFVVPDPPSNGVHEIRLESIHAKTFQDGPLPVPIVRGANPTLQVYERLLNAIFDRAATHAVLHAGALVAPGGGALLIAGPSGFGKTSLTLELLERGFGFLSDDYAPIDLATGGVHPYPRTVGLLPGGSARTPRRFAEAAAEPQVPRLLGKALVDVGEVLGEAAVARDPVPVSHVVLLEAGQPSEEPYQSVVHLGVWPRGVAETEVALVRMPGLDVLGRNDREDITIWRVQLRHAALATRAFSELLDRDFVAYSETRPVAEPDFSHEPHLTPLKRREAATLLCREMQNRRPRGRLMREYRGDTTALFLDVAASLGAAECWRLEVGRFDPTALLLQELTH